MIEAFQTDRLAGERLSPEHFDLLCRMHQDLQVMATLGGQRTHEQTRQFLQTNLDHWDQHGYGLWIVRDRTDGRFAGRGGLRHIQVGGGNEVEVSYALLAEFWGRGLAGEIAAALVQLAFGPLQLANVVCYTLPANRASQRVMEKVGFHYERDVVYAELPHVFYRLFSPNRNHV
jgi:ribosomal-protein-alanine N-acetyltransferase